MDFVRQIGLAATSEKSVEAKPSRRRRRLVALAIWCISALLSWIVPIEAAIAQVTCSAGQVLTYEATGAVYASYGPTCNDSDSPSDVIAKMYPSVAAAGGAISGACDGSWNNVQVTWGPPAWGVVANQWDMPAQFFGGGPIYQMQGTIIPVCQTGYFVAVPPSTVAPAPLPSTGSTCSECKTGAVSVGHPIDPGSGNEFESVMDYRAGDPRLRFTRVYNSGSVVSTALGGHWQHNFSAQITDAYSAYQSSGAVAGYVSDVYATAAEACSEGWPRIATASAVFVPATAGATATFNTATNTCQLSTGQSIPVYGTAATAYDVFTTTTTYPAVMAVYRPDGAVYIFQCSNGTCTPNADVPLQLIPGSNGYTLIDEDGNTEVYGNNGALLSITDKTGYEQMLTYNGSNNLLEVTDSTGRALQFGYNSNGTLATVTQPDGGVIQYGYDSIQRLSTVTYPDKSVLTYQYGPSSLSVLLTGVVDESGQQYASFSYDGQGRAAGDSLAGGVDNVSVVYNADGSASITDALGVARTYQYQLVNGRQKFSAMQGPPCDDCGIGAASTYDSNGYPASSADFNGITTATTYNSAGLLVQQVDAQGQAVQRTTATTWNTTLRVPLTRTVGDAGGNTVSSTQWVYNAMGEPLARCDIDPANSAASGYTCSNTGAVPAGVRRWTYTYCAAVDTVQCPLVGLMLSATGPRTDLTQTTTYSYYMSSSAVNCGTPGAACYQAGDLQTVTDALGHVTTIASYDADGRITRITDANGVNADMTYTPRGWLASRTVGGAATSFAYTPYGAVQVVTDPDGVTTTYGYDAAHRLVKIADALGNTIQYTLDAAGDKTAEQVYDSSGTLHKSLTRSFNTLGQLTTVVDGLNHAVFNASASGSYDANGNLIQSSDGLGIQRQLGYDALNRLVQTLDNYNGADAATQNTTTKYNYDSLDRLTQVTDPSSLNTTYSYDGLGDATGQVSPDTGTTSRAFDAAGNVLTRTDAKGITATYIYDALDRLISTSYPDSTQNVTYSYDDPSGTTGCGTSYPIGRLTRIVENGVTTVYCYDARGNVIQKQQITGAGTDTVAYALTAAGRLSGLTYPSGTQIAYTRDGDGRIQSVVVTPSGGAASTAVSGVTYQPFGPVSGYTLGNGQAISRTYDANYRLTDLTSPAFNLHVARDAMGNITAIGNAPGANPAAETYSYDPLYRLTAVTEASGTVLESVTYNPTGDRLSKAGSGLATGTYSYNPGTHQLIATGNAARTVDANGNTTAISQAGSVYGFGYSQRNRMVVAQLGGGTVGSYSYNALGQRIQKVAGSAAERYAYDEASQLLGEYGATNRDYLWLDGIPVANVDINGTTSTIAYVTADQLGTPRTVADINGNTEWQNAYQGNPWNEVAPSSNGYAYNLGFPGQYFDAETGLVYNVARYYDAAIGRFDQADPSGFKGGIGLYVYGFNSPLMYVDPTGLSPPGVPPPMGPFLPPPWAELELPRTVGGYPDPLTPAACKAAYNREMDANTDLGMDWVNDCNSSIPNPDDPNGPVMCRVNAGAMWQALDYNARRHLNQCVASCQ